MAQPVAILITDYGDGGVERMLINTCNALCEHGVEVVLLIKSREVRYIEALNPNVRVIELGRKQVPARLEQVLRELRPCVVMTSKPTDDALAVHARAKSGVRTRLIFRVGAPLVERIHVRALHPLRIWWTTRSLRRLYAQADGYIAVSQGIADDLVQGLGCAPERVHVFPNPTVTPQMFEQAQLPAGHRWMEPSPSAVPVILGVGGLRQQKNFQSLVRAFARVRAERPCRLLILGEGRQRGRLLALATRLGVADDVDLPGWQTNPYAFMSRAATFVLSSLWEGSPNVLVEAAALGVPVVATDCVAGPREILQGGRYGALVAVNDVAALAAAISRTLATPLAAAVTREAAAPFTMDRCARSYIRVLGLEAATQHAGTAA